MRAARWGLLLSGLTLAGSVAAAEAPGDWLMQMSDAARTANYQGVIVYRGDEILETFRVTHRFAQGSERERVQSLTGEVREVLKQNDKVTCLLPKDQRLTANRPTTPKALFQTLTPARLQQITSVYELRELGKARVAGRNCRGLAVKPRDEFRYGYEVWADEDTKVPLKLSLLTPDGRLLEQMFFTEVNFPATIADAAFESQLPAEQARVASETAASAIATAHEQEPVTAVAAAPAAPVEAPAAQIAQLPPGFRVVRRELSASPAGIREHLVLSDGMSAVSVYRVLRPAGDAAAAQRLDQMGPLNAYSRMVGQVQVTVLGEAPGRTIKMIGDSLDTLPPPVAPATSPEPPAPH